MGEKSPGLNGCPKKIGGELLPTQLRGPKTNGLSGFATHCQVRKCSSPDSEPEGMFIPLANFLFSFLFFLGGGT